jgi:3-hydroxyisobutyrate dehydrogenase-like beta-hydroxyacid dehydrogenase
VREVVSGEGGLLDASPPPRVIVVLSTVTLETIRWTADQARPCRVEVLDCGVSGGPKALAKGSITAMVGGSEQSVEIARPVLSAFADPVVHCGELGNGMRAKLARNLITYSQWYVAWEATRLATEAGVPRDRFVEVVQASDRWLDSHMFLVEAGVGFEPAATTGIGNIAATYADKDLRAALALAEELGVEAPAAELALSRLDQLAGLHPSAQPERQLTNTTPEAASRGRRART